MDLQERRYSVLLVSASEKFNQSLLSLLPEDRYYPVSTAANVASARRQLLESRFDIVLRIVKGVMS